MGQHQLCDANADHTARRSPGHEGRGEEQDEERIKLPQLAQNLPKIFGTCPDGHRPPPFILTPYSAIPDSYLDGVQIGYTVN